MFCKTVEIVNRKSFDTRHTNHQLRSYYHSESTPLSLLESHPFVLLWWIFIDSERLLSFCSVSNRNELIRSHGAISIAISPKTRRAQGSYLYSRFKGLCVYLAVLLPLMSGGVQHKNIQQHNTGSYILLMLYFPTLIYNSAAEVWWPWGWAGCQAEEGRAWLELRLCWWKPPLWRPQEVNWSLSFSTLSVGVNGHISSCVLASKFAWKSREQRERRQWFHRFQSVQLDNHVH